MKTVYLYYSSSIAVEVEDTENMTDEEIIETAREMAENMYGDICDNLCECREEACVEED